MIVDGVYFQDIRLPKSFSVHKVHIFFISVSKVIKDLSSERVGIIYKSLSSSQVWLSDYSFMTFRPLRQHPECTTCVKHKILIRSLGHHIHARVRQQEEYHQHLSDQYLDRVCYWTSRGNARIPGTHQLTLVVDGMDQSKFMWPRHHCMKTKEFAAWSRPRCHVIGAILHGRSIHFAVSRPDLPKDASRHCELVAFVLTNLVKEDGLCLRDFSLTLQCDNTSRECKNNVMMSFLGSLVSKGLLP